MTKGRWRDMTSKTGISYKEIQRHQDSKSWCLCFYIEVKNEVSFRRRVKKCGLCFSENEKHSPFFILSGSTHSLEKEGSKMDRNRFFEEVTRICASQGKTAGEINDGCLPLVFTSSGSPICRISEDGEVQYGEPWRRISHSKSVQQQKKNKKYELFQILGYCNGRK